MEYLPSNILSFSYAKNILNPDTREHSRMKRYASRMNEYHIVVFTKKKECFPSFQQEGNLFIYATNARTKIGMILQAIKIGFDITKSREKENWIVSSQDPFESSLVGRIVAKKTRQTHHVQIHGDVFNPLSYRESWLQRLRVFYGKRVVRSARHIRVVSSRVKDSLIGLGVADSCINILPIQADLKNFLDIGKNREYQIPETINFLYVGRFSKEKNLSLLIKAFAKANDKDKGRLTLVGSGPLKTSLINLINDLNLRKCVEIKSWTNEVSAEMAEADVFCLASNHEGWGMVLLEALATGMPAITTDVGCVGECVIDGVSGQVVPVGSESKYVEAMKSYFNNPSLLAEQGVKGYEIAKRMSPSEEEYLDEVIKSYTF